MQNPSGKIYKNLKPQISDAIKESCYKIDGRLYNIANEVQKIQTYSVEPGVEIAKGLTKIIDKTIKDSINIGCDLSVVTKGILLGAFRASPVLAPEAHKTIHLLIKEILQPVFNNKGDVKQTTEGILVGIMVIAKEFKLNMQEALLVSKDNLLISAAEIDANFAEEIKKAIPSLDHIV